MLTPFMMLFLLGCPHKVTKTIEVDQEPRTEPRRPLVVDRFGNPDTETWNRTLRTGERVIVEVDYQHRYGLADDLREKLSENSQADEPFLLDIVTEGIVALPKGLVATYVWSNAAGDGFEEWDSDPADTFSITEPAGWAEASPPAVATPIEVSIPLQPGQYSKPLYGPPGPNAALQTVRANLKRAGGAAARPCHVAASLTAAVTQAYPSLGGGQVLECPVPENTPFILTDIATQLILTEPLTVQRNPPDAFRVQRVGGSADSSIVSFTPSGDALRLAYTAEPGTFQLGFTSSDGVVQTPQIGVSDPTATMPVQITYGVIVRDEGRTIAPVVQLTPRFHPSGYDTWPQGWRASNIFAPTAGVRFGGADDGVIGLALGASLSPGPGVLFSVGEQFGSDSLSSPWDPVRGLFIGVSLDPAIWAKLAIARATANAKAEGAADAAAPPSSPAHAAAP